MVDWKMAASRSSTDVDLEMMRVLVLLSTEQDLHVNNLQQAKLLHEMCLEMYDPRMAHVV